MSLDVNEMDITLNQTPTLNYNNPIFTGNSIGGQTARDSTIAVNHTSNNILIMNPSVGDLPKSVSDWNTGKATDENFREAKFRGLKCECAKDMHLTPSQREKMSLRLGFPEWYVQAWFDHYRASTHSRYCVRRWMGYTQDIYQQSRAMRPFPYPYLPMAYNAPHNNVNSMPYASTQTFQSNYLTTAGSNVKSMPNTATETHHSIGHTQNMSQQSTPAYKNVNNMSNVSTQNFQPNYLTTAYNNVNSMPYASTQTFQSNYSTDNSLYGQATTTSSPTSMPQQAPAITSAQFPTHMQMASTTAPSNMSWNPYASGIGLPYNSMPSYDYGYNN